MKSICVDVNGSNQPCAYPHDAFFTHTHGAICYYFFLFFRLVLVCLCHVFISCFYQLESKNVNKLLNTHASSWPTPSQEIWLFWICFTIYYCCCCFYVEFFFCRNFFFIDDETKRTSRERDIRTEYSLC